MRGQCTTAFSALGYQAPPLRDGGGATTGSTGAVVLAVAGGGCTLGAGCTGGAGAAGGALDWGDGAGAGVGVGVGAG
ncbi:MAG: hypothetical protein LC667_19000, partial [Thioalkalivibrio sp.]|nr:hypothetical protein [Thioalkalivibrio sp.]